MNGEFRLFDENAFERRAARHRMVLKILKNLIDQLHVNPPCGSKQLYYTKSAAQHEPQNGYFLIKMSRKHLVGDIALIFLAAPR